MKERTSEHRSQPIDLVPWTLQNREQLVLKPNDDYGGRGIVLGWTVDAGAWEAAVRQALATPYIVQERVTLPSEPSAFTSYSYWAKFARSRCVTRWTSKSRSGLPNTGGSPGLTATAMRWESADK